MLKRSEIRTLGPYIVTNNGKYYLYFANSEGQGGTLFVLTK